MHSRSLEIVVSSFALGMVLQALLLLRGRFRRGDTMNAALAGGFSLLGLLPLRHETEYQPAPHWFLVCALAAIFFATFFRERLLPRIGGRILLAWNILFVFVALRAGWTSPYLLAPLAIFSALTVVNAFSDIDRGFGWKVFFHAWFVTILVVLGFRGMDAGALGAFFVNDRALPERSPLDLALTGAAFLYLVTNAFFVLALAPFPVRRGQRWDERMEEVRGHMELLARGYVWEKDDPVRSLAVLVLLPLVLLAIARWGPANDRLIVPAAIALMPVLAGRIPDAPEAPPRPGPRPRVRPVKIRTHARSALRRNPEDVPDPNSPPTRTGRVLPSSPRGDGSAASAGRLAALLQRRWLIAVVLTVTLAGTGFSWYLADSRSSTEARNRFELDAERARLVIRERLNLYEYALHGARSLYAASHSVERDEWQSFVSGLSLGERYPGLKGLAYVASVPAADLAQYEKAARADGAPEFKAQRSPGHAQAFVVHFVEPGGENRDLLGLDLAADPSLRRTLEESRDWARPQLSGALGGLPQLAASGDVLFCLPIYRNGEAHWTRAERRAALQGWAVAPIRVAELVRAIGDEIPAGLDLQIRDGDDAAAGALLYDGHAHDADGRGRSGSLRQATVLEVAFHRWTLVLAERPGFGAVDRSRPLLVLLVGLLGSGLLTGLIWALGTARTRAVALAESMTQSLREREAEARKLAMVASRTDNGAVVMDAQGRIEWVNLGFTRITEYALEEVAGRDPATLLAGEQTDPALAAEMRACVKHGREFKGELLARAKSGEPVWMALEIQPVFDADGALTNFVAIQSDIRERKRAERELLEAKEAAIAASRAKSEFLANMSHEIRTPMNGVIGMTELLLDTELSIEQRQFAECTRVSAEGLLGIINDILDFSKIEAGKLDLQQIPFSLRGTLGATLKPLSVRADQKHLELLLDVAEGVPDAVIGDPSRLRQVVVNLVGNAVKFTDHGEVLVRVRTEGDDPDAAWLHFEVSDSGIGIPAEQQAHIFDAFAQADGTIERRYGGTGLGLAISAQLVRLMGGTLWVESEPGRGSTFHFTTRFAQQDEIAPGPAPVATEALRDLPVLVVDDNQTNRAILVQMLRNWGMRPTAVAGGAAGIAALRAAAEAGRPVPLVLLDVQMPEMDGFTVAERIRQEPALDGTLLVLLTSSGQMGDGARCRQLRVSGYLTKPVTGADLAEVVRSVLGEHAHPGEPRLVTRHTLREGQARYHVLLAEDNEVNRVLAAKLLTKRGHTYVAVNDGREALAALEAGGRFDLVLMDVQMPVMDGFEATAAIRAREAASGEHLPIVALTAHAMKGDLERCIAAGMDAYVSKPIRASELYELMDRLLAARDEQPGEDAGGSEAKAA